MPAAQHSRAAPTWVICTVAVRTRDGPERLDQVYRRLIDNTPDDQSQPAPAPQAGPAGAACTPKPRR
jgi:hypothetical protein